MKEPCVCTWYVDWTCSDQSFGSGGGVSLATEERRAEERTKKAKSLRTSGGLSKPTVKNPARAARRLTNARTFARLTTCTSTPRSPREENRRSASGLVLALTLSLLAVEAVAGVLTHSLALLADAAHMLTDVAALGLSFVAMRFAERPATPQQTFGFYRVEILATLANSVALIVLCRLHPLRVLRTASERRWR